MKKAKCPSCKAVLTLDEEIKIQELITCSQCKCLLELVRNFPPTLDWAEDPAVCSSRRIFTKMV